MQTAPILSHPGTSVKDNGALYACYQVTAAVVVWHFQLDNTIQNSVK